MNIRVKLFAAAKQAMELDEIEVAIDEGGTVADLRMALVEQHPQLQQWVQHAMFSLDADYVGNDHVISGTAEVALIPPVSGG